MGTMGGGSRGQLGLGLMSSEDRLWLVESLQPLKIVKVSAGGWHSLAMADTGDLYGWGWNESGQGGGAVDDDSSIPPQMAPSAAGRNTIGGYIRFYGDWQP